MSIAFAICTPVIGTAAESPLLMGFCRWPADISLEGIKTSDDFNAEHGNILAMHFDNGIPWIEAHAGKEYSADVQQQLTFPLPKRNKLYIALNPLSMGRDGLAPYWGEKDNTPLPEPWNKMAFNDPQVMQTYLNYAEYVIGRLQPDFLAIGVEVNILLNKNKEAWKQYKEFHRYVYTRLKEKHPNLPVFFTVDVLHLLGHYPEDNREEQEKEVRELLAYSDLFGMSIYPFMSPAIPTPFPEHFFDFARTYNKPIAVTETGFTTRNVRFGGIELIGDEEQQTHYYKTLLSTAKRDRYQFVITFATTDFNRMIEKLPESVRELAGVWQYTGMQTSEKKPKPALAVWDTYLKGQPVSPATSQ